MMNLFKKPRKVNANFIYRLLKNYEEYFTNAIDIGKNNGDSMKSLDNSFMYYETMIMSIMNEIQRES
jgi:hypothetical protein